MSGEVLAIDPEEYHRDLGRTSNSHIETWLRDRGDYEEEIVNGKRNWKATDEMKFGLYFEDLLFGVDVRERYVVAPARDDDPNKVIHRGTNAYKEFARSVAGRTIILPNQANRATAMIDAVSSHPVARKLVAQGRGADQVALHWKCPVSGLLMKGLPDRVLRLTKAAYDVVIDLKTDKDPRNTHERRKRWHQLGYHRKMAGYIDGWYEATGRNAVGFIVAVSNQGRVRCCVYMYEAGKPAVETGRVEYLAAAREIAEAKATGFYGYREEREAVEEEVPGWAAFEASQNDQEAA